MKVWALVLRAVLVAFVVLFCAVNCKKEDSVPNANASHGESPMGAQHKEGSPEAVKGPEPWLISFHDDAETSHFDGVTKWLENRNCPITETVNESYIKFLVATMSEADGN